MKNLKFTLLSTLICFLAITSCTNEDVTLEEFTETEESPSIMETMSKMSNNFDENGNVIAFSSANPSGNMIFDFCFDFVYPITMSYNNGTTVTVNDLDEFIQVLINSTDQLFINGIAFPFDVEVYDESTNAIVTQTINNESEFAVLLDDCDFDNASGCVCNAVYDPVCVEITDPSGSIFTVSYPNACEAQCDGFTTADFVDNCIDNNYFDFGMDCFDLNFPFDLILDDGSVITINNDDEFANAMFNQYVVNFVYPLSVTLEEDGSQVVINDELDLQTLFENCFGNEGPNPCPQCENVAVDPVCVEYTDASGNIVVELFPNLCFAECLGFSSADVVTCPDDNPTDDCTEQDVLDALTNCNIWSADVSGTSFIYEFELSTDTVTVVDGQDNVITSGDFTVIEEQSTGNVFILIDTASTNFADVWYFFDCDSATGFQVVSSSSSINNVQTACN